MIFIFETFFYVHHLKEIIHVLLIIADFLHLNLNFAKQLALKIDIIVDVTNIYVRIVVKA